MDEATEGFDVESNEALRELLHSELKIRLSFLLRISIKNWKVLIKYIAFQKEF